MREKLEALACAAITAAFDFVEDIAAAKADGKIDTFEKFNLGFAASVRFYPVYKMVEELAKDNDVKDIRKALSSVKVSFNL